ncbi:MULTISPECIES: cyclophane-containing peptide 2OG-Fe(II) oxygenase YhhC [unclassified Acinetobacter]|uniref:cyclophane-containing peptide 2OG-Fe(II) oxygenase YhhC n=4 Tax=Acinetobacter TaxID=469 RepID=UPI0018AB8E43|nr:MULTISPECIES: cyclophane-containing peptide 2OG-Fe(II) oxygenase YhhC [unclassified Acinetobacter]MBJ9955351.1 2OG-Fe(II) oxygenase [Acinetobacter baumannii]
MINISKDIPLEIYPYKHFFSNYSIDECLKESIQNWLLNDAQWNLVEASFYTQYEFSLKDTELPNFLKFIISTEYLSDLKARIEKIYAVDLLDNIDVVAHKLTKGHVIKIHNDFLNEDSIKESHRLLMHFNSNWNVENGGLCMIFTNNDASSIHNIIVPTGNLLQSFEISENSHHAVSEIYSGDRLTIIFTFYSR